jgi:hypothetical protein
MRIPVGTGNGTTQLSQCVFERVLLIGIRSAEGIRASGTCAPRQQAGHMAAPTSLAAAYATLANGEPSTHGYTQPSQPVMGHVRYVADFGRQGRRCPLSRGLGGFPLSSRHGGQVVWKAVPDPFRTWRRLLRKSGWARDLVRLWTGRTVSSGLSRSAEAVGDLSSGLSWVTLHWSACHRQWQRARGVPCQAFEVLDGGSEQKLVFGAAEPTEPEPGQGQIVLHVAE